MRAEKGGSKLFNLLPAVLASKRSLQAWSKVICWCEFLCKRKHFFVLPFRLLLWALSCHSYFSHCTYASHEQDSTRRYIPLFVLLAQSALKAAMENGWKRIWSQTMLMIAENVKREGQGAPEGPIINKILPATAEFNSTFESPMESETKERKRQIYCPFPVDSIHSWMKKEREGRDEGERDRD